MDYFGRILFTVWIGNIFSFGFSLPQRKWKPSVEDSVKVEIFSKLISLKYGAGTLFLQSVKIATKCSLVNKYYHAKIKFKNGTLDEHQ